MAFTYEREVSHCQLSTYVKLYTIKEVIPAQNADTLDVIRFHENWYQAVVRKGLFQVGQYVMFIPPESVLPIEVSEALGVRNYLHKGKVHEVKLRGNLSQGLVVDRDIIEGFAPCIMQWEDLPSTAMQGNQKPFKETPIDFVKFYKMPNLKNEPDTFKLGEDIYYSEKLNGTNCRFGVFMNPIIQQYELYVGTHMTVQQEGDTVYWNVVKQLVEKIEKPLPENVLFFGEIFGPKIQGSKFAYGQTFSQIRIFAIYGHSKQTFLPTYYSVPTVIDICNEYGFPHVTFHGETFKGKEWVESIADSPSEEGNPIREGVVLVSQYEPWRMAKYISSKYLAESGRKERH
jgi:RNA ligase (TIGR02306 family)